MIPPFRCPEPKPFLILFVSIGSALVLPVTYFFEFGILKDVSYGVLAVWGGAFGLVNGVCLSISKRTWVRICLSLLLGALMEYPVSLTWSLIGGSSVVPVSETQMYWQTAGAVTGFHLCHELFVRFYSLRFSVAIGAFSYVFTGMILAPWITGDSISSAWMTHGALGATHFAVMWTAVLIDSRMHGHTRGVG